MNLWSTVAFGTAHEGTFEEGLVNIRDAAELYLDGEAVEIEIKSQFEPLDETEYLFKSPENARRLLAAIDQLERGEGIQRDHIE